MIMKALSKMYGSRDLILKSLCSQLLGLLSIIIECYIWNSYFVKRCKIMNKFGII